MKNQNFIFLIGFLALLFVGCAKESFESQKMTESELNPELIQASERGATQISGLSRYPDGETCVDLGDADYALDLYEGNLVGCLMITVLTSDCSPSGTYKETGTELFVGVYNDDDGNFIGEGTFSTEYVFTGKFEDCETLEIEVFGRCQHPITPGSGTGVFEGVTGRLDFKDNVETGIFPYRGHLRY